MKGEEEKDGTISDPTKSDPTNTLPGRVEFSSLHGYNAPVNYPNQIPQSSPYDAGATMKILAQLLALSLCVSQLAFADGNTFNRVRYNGGSVNSKVDPKNWGNKLTVTSDLITLSLKDHTKVDIPPKSVTGLSYGQEAHRRVGTMVTLAILVAPVALFGLMMKTRLHFIAIQYTDSSNKDAAILLQGDKDNYRAILVALQGVTGLPVSVSEKDREFVPVEVRSAVSPATTDQSEGPKADTKPVAAPPQVDTGDVNLTSDPTGADISLDGNFIGNSPATLKLAAGPHTITVKMAGYTDWTRQITIQAGSQVQLTATLEKAQ
jgi:PEGA domain-containing protein